MGCCGDKRQAMTPARGAAQPAPASIPTFRGAVTLHYTQRAPVRVRGPLTGREYSFSVDAPDQPVDARDADALLATRFFKKTG